MAYFELENRKFNCKRKLIALLFLVILPSYDNFEMICRISLFPERLLLRRESYRSFLRWRKPNGVLLQTPAPALRMCIQTRNGADNPEKYDSSQNTLKSDKPRLLIRIFKSVARLLSQFVLFFSSKYGPIQKIYRAVVFEVKIATRAFNQESRRFKEEFRKRQLTETLNNMADVGSEVSSNFQDSDESEGFTTDTELGSIRDSVRPRIDDDNSDEGRILNERQRQFFKAIGLKDSPDEDADLLSSEYKKHLEYYEGVSCTILYLGEMIMVFELFSNRSRQRSNGACAVD